MPDYQGTLFFQDNASSYGWTENYFYEGVADIDAALALLAVLIPLRAAVLTDRHNLAAGRVSDIAVLNDSKLVSGLPVVGDVVSTNLTVVQPWTALLTRNEATSLYRGRTFFHGTLETTFTSGRNYDTGNPQAADWTALFTEMVDRCSLKHKVGLVTLLTPYSAILPLRQVERKVGRPFNLLRGRRRTVA